MVNIKFLSLSNSLFTLAIFLFTFSFSIFYSPSSLAGAFQCPNNGPLLPEPATISDCPTDVPFDVGDKGCDSTSLTRDNCGIVNIIVIGINFLSAVAGLAIVFSLMFAGFQYMTAGDNSGQIQKSKQRIIWAITALFLFIFMYALLNFLIPGGVL